jgi:hypothetical protein
MATYFTPALAVAVAGGLVGDGVGFGVADGRDAGAAEHAVTNAAQITPRIANSRFLSRE